MEEIKYFKSDKFKAFDWDLLIQGEHSTNDKNYSFARGGNGFPAGNGWCISIYNEDGNKEEVWALPEPLSKFLDWSRLQGGKEKLSEIKNILGL